MLLVKQGIKAIASLFLFFLLEPEESFFVKKLYSVMYLLHSVTGIIYNLKEKKLRVSLITTSITITIIDQICLRKPNLSLVKDYYLFTKIQ